MTELDMIQQVAERRVFSTVNSIMNSPPPWPGGGSAKCLQSQADHTKVQN